MRITVPTTVGDLNEVYDMDVINLDPKDFEYKQVTVPLEECSLIYQSSNASFVGRSRSFCVLQVTGRDRPKAKVTGS